MRRVELHQPNHRRPGRHHLTALRLDRRDGPGEGRANHAAAGRHGGHPQRGARGAHARLGGVTLLRRERVPEAPGTSELTLRGLEPDAGLRRPGAVKRAVHARQDLTRADRLALLDEHLLDVAAEARREERVSGPFHLAREPDLEVRFARLHHGDLHARGRGRRDAARRRLGGRGVRAGGLGFGGATAGGEGR